MPSLIGQNIGKYRVVARLGRGGMAEVYKAYQSSLDRYVAIKVLHGHLADEEDFIARFKREAKAVANLRHPNIVQIFDFDVQDEMYYMAMEYVNGPTLKAELEARSRKNQLFSLEESARIMIALCSAIDYAHSRGMVHRDLKPANFILTEEGQILVLDFGIAKMVDATKFTATGAVVGTPAYMSPEQGQGERGDERSDIYSLGVVLYHLATGKVPYDADTPFAVIMKHITSELPLPSLINPALPEAVERIILKALSKNPDDRFQSGAEFADAIRAAIGLSANDTLNKTPLLTIAPPPKIKTPPPKTATPSSSDSTTTVPCPHCGAPTPAGSKFCVSCGTNLTLPPAAPKNAPRPVPPAPPPPSKPAYVPATKSPAQKSSKLLWGLASALAILLLCGAIIVALFFFNKTKRPPTRSAADLTLQAEATLQALVTQTAAALSTPAAAPEQNTPTPLPSSTPPSINTNTPVPPTVTSKSKLGEAIIVKTPTNTPAPPTDTPAPPTNTSAPPTNTPSPTPTATPLPDQGKIILQGSPAHAGLKTQVQWVDGNNNWHNVENWQGKLDNAGRISWLVWPKDFNAGPFRWQVFNPNGSTQFVSAPFYLPSAGQSYLVTLEAPPPPTITPTPVPLGQNCASDPGGTFAGVWPDYRNLLGCPMSHQLTIPIIAEEEFQGGHLFWRSDLDQLYVIYDRDKGTGAVLAQGNWQTDPTWKWDGSYPDGIGLTPPPGLVEPKRGFGWAWRSFLNSENGPLGWALDKEYGFDNTGQAQNFEQGIMFKGSSPKIYVLLSNGQFYAR